MTDATHPDPADRYAELNGLRIHYLDWGTRWQAEIVTMPGLGHYPTDSSRMTSINAGKW